MSKVVAVATLVLGGSTVEAATAPTTGDEMAAAMIRSQELWIVFGYGLSFLLMRVVRAAPT